MVDETTRWTVLVVGANDSTERILLRILRTDGFDIRRAADGTAALVEIGDQVPDFIIVVATPPAIDELELCRQLRTAEATRRTPILFHAAAESLEVRVDAVKAGANEFIAKPYYANILRGHLRSLIGLKTRPVSDAGMRRVSRRPK